MAILKNKDARALESAALMDRLAQVKTEFNRESGLVKTGGRATNPGRIKEMRRTIARILTIIHEKKLGIRGKEKAGAQKAQAASKPNGSKGAAKAAAPKKSEVKKVA